MSSAIPLIQAINIHKYYGPLHVLKGVSLDIYPREIVVLMGPSGAGKSTLLQILGTLEVPDEGDLILFGQHFRALSNKQLALLRNQKLGFVFQFHFLLPEFTALENVMMPALIGGTREREARPRAEALLAQLGLQDRMHHYPSQLSGGEQQRVAVARALMNKPQVLLADEPTGNLDICQTEQMIHLFQRLCDEEGYSLVIVTHNPVFQQIAHRLFTILDGQIHEGFHL